MRLLDNKQNSDGIDGIFPRSQIFFFLIDFTFKVRWRGMQQELLVESRKT